jgi:hypothetical protein
MKRKNMVLLFLCAVVLQSHLFGYDILHFYRATPFIPEPRFERDNLCTIDLWLHTGISKKAKNGQSNTVPLLDSFSPVFAKTLAAGVPFLDPNNPLDAILLQLQALPDNQRFSKLSFSGKLITSEAHFFFTKNMPHGFFLQLHLPIRSCEITSVHMTDLSPTAGSNTQPNQGNAVWQQFLQQFDAILKRHSVSLKPFEKTVIGNPTFFVGFTHTFLEYPFIDFIDLNLGTGITINTTSRDSSKHVFVEPFFSRSHTGIPFQFRAAVGMFDWLTVCAYTEITFFFARHTKRRVTTATQQGGYIHLAVSDLTVEKGPNIHTVLYIKGDHFIRGFSWTIGYSFAYSGPQREHSTQRSLFPYDAINQNKLLKSWNMHTMHYFIEYDFSAHNATYGPRILIGYDQVLGGKRIIKTGLLTASIGLDWLL